jgi:hypothetical protein
MKRHLVLGVLVYFIIQKDKEKKRWIGGEMERKRDDEVKR